MLRGSSALGSPLLGSMQNLQGAFHAQFAGSTRQTHLEATAPEIPQAKCSGVCCESSTASTSAPCSLDIRTETRFAHNVEPEGTFPQLLVAPVAACAGCCCRSLVDAGSASLLVSKDIAGASTQATAKYRTIRRFKPSGTIA